MSAGVYDIVVEQGASFDLDIQLNHTSGEAKDLTGYSVRGKIRATAPGVEIVSFTATVVSVSGGMIHIALTPTQTTALVTTGASHAQYEEYVYDVEIYTSADAIVERVLNGRCLVSPEVTRT